MLLATNLVIGFSTSLLSYVASRQGGSSQTDPKKMTKEEERNKEFKRKVYNVNKCIAELRADATGRTQLETNKKILVHLDADLIIAKKRLANLKAIEEVLENERILQAEEHESMFPDEEVE